MQVYPTIIQEVLHPFGIWSGKWPVHKAKVSIDFSISRHREYSGLKMCNLLNANPPDTQCLSIGFSLKASTSTAFTMKLGPRNSRHNQVIAFNRSALPSHRHEQGIQCHSPHKLLARLTLYVFSTTTARLDNVFQLTFGVVAIPQDLAFNKGKLR